MPPLKRRWYYQEQPEGAIIPDTQPGVPGLLSPYARARTSPISPCPEKAGFCSTSGTVSCAISLRAPYAMSGTDLAYDPTRPWAGP
eukprot:731985-Rhodomonas_salina.3